MNSSAVLVEWPTVKITASLESIDTFLRTWNYRQPCLKEQRGTFMVAAQQRWEGAIELPFVAENSFPLVSLKRIQDSAGVFLGNDSVQRDLDWFFTIRQIETDVVKSVFFEEIATFVNSCFRQDLHFKFQATRFILCF